MSFWSTVGDIGLIGADIATFGQASKWAKENPYERLGVYGDIMGAENKFRRGSLGPMLNAVGMAAGMPGMGTMATNVIDATNPPVTKPGIPSEQNITTYRANAGLFFEDPYGKKQALKPEDVVEKEEPQMENVYDFTKSAQDQLKTIAGLSSFVDLFGGVGSLGYLGAMSKYKYHTAIRPNQLDYYDPSTAYRSIRATDDQRSDRFFNSMVRSARESGTPPVMSTFLENQNTVAARRAQELTSILQSAAQLNASIGERNMTSLATFQGAKDQQSLLNQQRKEQILGAAVTVPHQVGTSILQNYLNSIASQSNLLNNGTY